MAGEVSIARERRANPINSTGRAMKVPKGRRLNYDDDIVTVYDEKGKKVSEGMWDYSPYNNDETYETMKWDDTAKNYKLAHGYRMVVKNRPNGCPTRAHPQGRRKYGKPSYRVVV